MQLQVPTYPRVQPAHFDAHVVLDLPFDEGAGQLVHDYSGHDNHGTLVNMEEADWVAGSEGRGRALDFDGVNEYVSFGNVINFGATDDFSISLWLKTTDVDAWVFQKIQTVVLPYYFVGVFGGKARFKLFDALGNAPTIDSVANINDGNEHHLLVVRLAGANLYLYIDGESAAVPINDITIATLSNAGALEMARWSLGGASHLPLDGAIGRDVQVCRRALSAQNALRLFEQSRSRYRIG